MSTTPSNGSPNSRYLVPGALLLVGALGLAGALYSRSHRAPDQPETPTSPVKAGTSPLTATAGGNAAEATTTPLKPVDAVGSMSDHAGWFGSVVVPGMVLAVVEIPADSSAARVYRDQYPAAAGFIQVTAFNRTSVQVTLDLSKSELVKRDNSTVPAADRAAILEKATGRKDLVLARHNVPYPIGPSSRLADGLIFVPAGLKLDDVTGISVQVGSGRVVVPGHVYTADQKKALFRSPSPSGEAATEGAAKTEGGKAEGGKAEGNKAEGAKAPAHP